MVLKMDTRGATLYMGALGDTTLKPFPLSHTRLIYPVTILQSYAKIGTCKLVRSDLTAPCSLSRPFKVVFVSQTDETNKSARFICLSYAPKCYNIFGSWGLTISHFWAVRPLIFYLQSMWNVQANLLKCEIQCASVHWIIRPSHKLKFIPCISPCKEAESIVTRFGV